MIVRDAKREDVPAIVAMLADDTLGRSRERFEDPLPQPYWDAFAAIEADPNNRFLIAEIDSAVAACLQLTFIPGLSRLGAGRAQIESVRVASAHRGDRADGCAGSGARLCGRRQDRLAGRLLPPRHWLFGDRAGKGWRLSHDRSRRQTRGCPGDRRDAGR